MSHYETEANVTWLHDYLAVKKICSPYITQNLTKAPNRARLDGMLESSNEIELN